MAPPRPRPERSFTTVRSLSMVSLQSFDDADCSATRLYLVRTHAVSLCLQTRPRIRRRRFARFATESGPSVGLALRTRADALSSSHLRRG